MREKLIRIRKAENGYILTIYFVGSHVERTVICQNLEEVHIDLINEFEPSEKTKENIGNVQG